MIRIVNPLVIFVLLIFTVLSTLAGCKKEEQAVEEPVYGILRFRAMTADPFRFTVVEDEITILTQDLISGNESSARTAFVDPQHRLQLYDFFSGGLLLDTTVRYRKLGINPLTFFQEKPGGKIALLGPPQDLPPATAGYTKLSIAYIFSELPDSIWVVAENATSVATTAPYEPTDSFKLKRGAISPVFESRFALGNRVQLKCYTANGSRTLIGTASGAAFSELNSDYSVMLFYQKTNGGGAVANLSGVKIY